MTSNQVEPILTWDDLECILPVINCEMFPFLETEGHGPIFMCSNFQDLKSKINDLYMEEPANVKFGVLYRLSGLNASGHTIPLGVQLRVNPSSGEFETHLFCTDSLGSTDFNTREHIKHFCETSDTTYAYCLAHEDIDSQIALQYARQHVTPGCNLFALLDLRRMITEDFLDFAQRNSRLCSLEPFGRIYSLQKLPDSFMVLSQSMNAERKEDRKGLIDYIESETTNHLVDIFGGIPTPKLQHLDDNFLIHIRTGRQNILEYYIIRFFELLSIKDYRRTYYQDYESVVVVPSTFLRAVLGYDGRNYAVRVFNKYLRTLLLSNERVPRPDQWIQNANTDRMQVLAGRQGLQTLQIQDAHTSNVVLLAGSWILIKTLSMSPSMRRQAFDIASRISEGLATESGDPAAADSILQWMCDTFNSIFGRPRYVNIARPRQLT